MRDAAGAVQLPMYSHVIMDDSSLLTSCSPLQVVAKCETRQALFNFRSIVTAADAIIISRGNLGLDVVSH